MCMPLCTRVDIVLNILRAFIHLRSTSPHRIKSAAKLSNTHQCWWITSENGPNGYQYTEPRALHNTNGPNGYQYTEPRGLHNTVTLTSVEPRALHNTVTLTNDGGRLVLMSLRYVTAQLQNTPVGVSLRDVTAQLYNTVTLTNDGGRLVGMSLRGVNAQLYNTVTLTNDGERLVGMSQRDVTAQNQELCTTQSHSPMMAEDWWEGA
ncbi:hypothetical protein J6590_012828 [Homalodisca vitripennis]|nr:hypothetical protein J6590_012828 [Homalodisca vitripennis]